MRSVPIAMIVAVSACAPSGSEAPPAPAADRTALAAEIEAAVGTMLPDIVVSQYARHYTTGADGHVHAVYLRECGEGWATCAEAKAIWTTPDKLPLIPLDGGCGIVRVEYDPAHNALVTATCNGEA